MGLLAKHTTNSITLRPTSTSFLGKKLERKRRTNASEGLGPLNFLDFFSTMGHMKATTFWSKGKVL
jgi:hypothetical protein